MADDFVMDGDAGSEGRAHSGSREAYERFLLAEYDHIAKAHFNTVTTISQFFQYYVLIASVPVSAAVAFGKLSEWGKDGSLRSLVHQNTLIPAIALSLLALVGFLVMGYIINLRHDALLYARAVNGIRRYFFNRSGLGPQEEQRYRVLPRSPALPQYCEPGYFLFVVLAFTVIDGAYCCAGWWLNLRLNSGMMSWLLLVVGVAVAAHLALYSHLSKHRELHYLRSHTIGVDIDGVLGMHRECFCDVLHRVCGGPLVDAGRLDRMPVRDCEGLGLTEKHEQSVFHQACYWCQMKPYPMAGYVLGRLHDIINYQVHIFSWRPWPIWKYVPLETRPDVRAAWAKSLIALQGDVPRERRRVDLDDDNSLTAIFRRLRRMLTRRPNLWWLPIRQRLSESWAGQMRTSASAKAQSMADSVRLRWYCTAEELRPGYLIGKITATWLARHGIVHTRLTIERGNTDSPYPLGRSVNRFSAARRQEMRVFVEDDLAKALRLSGICEIVFLIDHPYNHADDLPNNVIRVRSWNEIYNFIRHEM